MSNRLADSLSPYLQQHADNPVDWQEWGAEAFAQARERNVPVLLSVGYAACHWCHVMAHESFDDHEIAARINERFVPVKVDREERPDVDAAYMRATVATTGQGGWPMTCLLTPTGEPFFCGTYFPREAFARLLDSAHDVWTTQQEAVVEQGRRYAQVLADAASGPAGADLTATDLDAAVDQLAQVYDGAHAGFGGAPKFPPSMALEFLLRHHDRTGRDDALRMVEATAERMARGGMYDQLAGGFARYAVDEAWVVPHFEKMLYDNAQLLGVYTHLWRATRSELARRVACETAEFIIRDLGTDEGGFASALDADTDGVEGATYVWTPAQLAEVLGDDDGRRAATLLRVTGAGTFEHGTSTLQLPQDPDDPHWWDGVRERLTAARTQRPQPARDDKVVTAWNGLAIASLADAAVAFDRPDLLDAATRCAAYLLDSHIVDKKLRRVSRDGVTGPALGQADDHGDLSRGLLALHQATGHERWLAAAEQLLEDALHRFGDGAGGFYDTPRDGERLYLRTQDASDNAEPSGQSALAEALLTASALTTRSDLREAAVAAIAAASGTARQSPRFGGWLLAAAEAHIAGPLAVAIVLPDDAAPEAARDLLAVARAAGYPGLVIQVGPTDALPLLAARPAYDDRPTAYVCRGPVCQSPVTSAEELERVLRQVS